MRPEDRKRLLDALGFALEAHGDQTRKESEIPYASHLLQVAGLVQEHGGDVVQAIAALLHDTMEDCGVTHGELSERFGAEVADIVASCTDTEPGGDPARKQPWKERKTAYLAHLREVPARHALVSACDKRHNLGALVADVRAVGPVYLERFNAPADQQLWYFAGIVEALGPKIPPRLRQELEAALAEFRALVASG